MRRPVLPFALGLAATMLVVAACTPPGPPDRALHRRTGDPRFLTVSNQAPPPPPPPRRRRGRPPPRGGARGGGWGPPGRPRPPGPGGAPAGPRRHRDRL